MAFIMSDRTEGSFLRKTNELLVTNGFRRMPFSEEQLTRKDKLLTDKQREETKGKSKKAKENFSNVEYSSSEPQERTKDKKIMRRKRGRNWRRSSPEDSESYSDESNLDVEQISECTDERTAKETPEAQEGSNTWGNASRKTDSRSRPSSYRSPGVRTRFLTSRR